MAQSARLEFRVRPETKEQIEDAAKLAGLAVSDFVRAAAEERADQVLRDHGLVDEVRPHVGGEDILRERDVLRALARHVEKGSFGSGHLPLVLSDDDERVFVAGNRALDEQEILLRVAIDDREADLGDALGTNLPGNLLTLEDARRGR